MIKTPTTEQVGKVQRLGIKPGLPNCGMVTLAYFLNKPVEDVTALYRKTYHKAHNWKGRTYCNQRLAFLNQLGVKTRARLTRSTTLGQWMRTEADPSKIYEVTTTSHTMVYDRGTIIDQHGIQTSWAIWSRTRMQRLTEILTGE